MKLLTPGNKWFSEMLNPALTRASESILIEQGSNCKVGWQAHDGFTTVIVEGENERGQWNLRGEFRLCEVSDQGYGCDSQVAFKLPDDDELRSGTLQTSHNRGLTPAQLAVVISHDFWLLATLVALGDSERAHRLAD